MKDAFYLNQHTALINFSQKHYKTVNDVVASDAFKQVLLAFLDHLKSNQPKLYFYCLNNQPQTIAIKQLDSFIKLLMILPLSEIDSPYLAEKELLMEVVEEMYQFWRDKQRCTIIKQAASEKTFFQSFIDVDNEFNQLIVSVYRIAQEKLQGQKNHVYRQLNAGSNASMILREVKWNIPFGYEVLKGISFVDSVLLRTPLLLHPKSTTRSGSFKLVDPVDISSFELTKGDWFCYPAKVGPLLTHIYFHKDYTFTALPNANIFELATFKEVSKGKPDNIVFFGVTQENLDCVYFVDEKQDITIGLVPYQEKIDYFGYMKKMVLTLHNATMMRKGYLPLHGSMVNLTFKNDVVKGIVLIGDSGAGKSETIEAIQMLQDPDLLKIDVIFDDMGSLVLTQDDVFAIGSEIGAFVRLDDLDAGSPYKNMERSVFMNPESTNARVIIPVNTYQQISKQHKVDYFLYANNYDQQVGIEIGESAQQVKEAFVLGKRMALATTDETGLSTTYFANPFGPMQQQKECDMLIDQAFELFDKHQVKVGQIFTGLGVNRGNLTHLNESAKALMAVLKSNT